MANVPSSFLRVRGIVLGLISYLAFMWILLLCIVIFLHWNDLDHSERALMVVMLIINTLTVVMSIILLYLSFKAWLDAARIGLLLIMHIGVAGLFSYWWQSFRCLASDSDIGNACKLFGIYILISSWIIPVILILYAVVLALMVYQKRKVVQDNLDEVSKNTLPDNHHNRPSILPMMKVPDAAVMRPMSIIPIRYSGNQSQPRTPTLLTPSHTLDQGDSRFSLRAGTRLSKPIAMVF